MLRGYHFGHSQEVVNKIACLNCNRDICLYRVSSEALESHQCDACFGYEEDSISEEMEYPSEYEDEDPACTEMYTWEGGDSPPCSNLTYVQHNHETCPICLNVFGDGEIVVRTCKSITHLFHEGCMLNWLERSKTCPLCRQ